MSVVASENDLIAAGAEIIWVMERTASNAPGTADNCYTFMAQLGSVQGWCVGDSQTFGPSGPAAGTFDNSPFSVARGFDMIVPTGSMSIVFSSSHGSPGGNQNMTGADLLLEVEAVVAGLP